VRALSTQQPWAYAITHGTKRVENRVWYAHYRGPLLLHAGKVAQADCIERIHHDSPEVSLEGMRSAPRGVLVGWCLLVACVREYEVAEDQHIWAGGPWCFVLNDVRAFATPIAYKGALGFFEVPDVVVAEALAP
jgi:ASCH domain-containing protein